LKSGELARKVVEKLDLVSLAEFNPSLRPPGLSSYLNPMQYIPESWKPATDPEPAPEAEDAAADEPATGSSKNMVSDAWKLALGATPKVKLTGEALEQQHIRTATGIFRSKLKISQREKYSSVVNIGFESLDPNLAAKIANLIPEMYIIGQLEAKLEATEKATTWLNDQLEELKIKVEASEQAVQMYREQYDLTESKSGELGGLVIDQLSAISSQLIIARSERAQAEAHLRQIRKLAKSQGSGLESASGILSSDAVQGLRRQEAESARKLSDHSTVYGAKHPKIIQAKAELADIRSRIKREIDKVVEGLKNDVDLARIRESSLESSLGEFKQASGEQNRESVQLRSLEREAAANRAVFETFLSRFKEASSTGGLHSEADARVISKAGVPGAPSYPKKKQVTMLIVAGAFVFAAMLVFLLQAVNSGVMNPEQVERQMGIPAIGLIPSVKGGVKPHDYVLEKPQSSYCESLNSLRTSLILSEPDDAVKTIQITSSVPEEGKSTLALSFARLLAQSGKKVILVDGDLRRASLEKKLGVSTRRKGLTDMVMSSGADLAEFVSKDTKSKLLMMPRGEAKYVNASDIFSSRRMATIIAFLRKHFDYVIFDMPPVMAVSDARIMGRLVDKTVFVVQWDKTPKKVVQTAIRQLITHDVDIAGCVLQQVNLKRYSGFSYGDSGYYYHYGKYGQYYSS
ncbi:MAG: polysaccharide biosynthesis tyrosine autokinase, partial [Proteobacteria bacterium]|nr:polysaccharide biosynthesis tyrosine autokinase [Pseudomonadota bacterium]